MPAVEEGPPPHSQPPESDDLATNPRLLAIAKALRKVLPGDSRFGDDPLSTAGGKQSQILGRRLADATAERPTVLREAGLTALQVLDAMGQTLGRIPVHADLTIAFTDLVDFSKWSLEAGDAAAVELLREVSVAIEPPVAEQAGKVVKRLGDGMMAVFAVPADALAAVEEAQHRLTDVEVGGYRPRLRAGMHVGRPERVGDDYFGVDVNVAARVAEAASAGEILVLGPGARRARRGPGQGEAQAALPGERRAGEGQGLLGAQRNLGSRRCRGRTAIAGGPCGDGRDEGGQIPPAE